MDEHSLQKYEEATKEKEERTNLNDLPRPHQLA